MTAGNVLVCRNATEPCTNMSLHPFAQNHAPTLRNDVTLAAILIAVCVAARLLPHEWNLSPVAAAALFAGWTMGRRSIAVMVPVVALLISNVIAGGDDPRIMAVVYAGLALPAGIGMFARRYRASLAAAPSALASSAIFFVASNWAVWQFSGIYSLDTAGLTQCFVAALPFFKYTVAGDLLWTAALFGGAWMVQRAAGRAAEAAQSA